MAELRHWQHVHGGETLEEVAGRFGSSLRDYTPLRGDTLDAPPAVANVNSGRWIVPCPFCAGAEYVNFDDLRFFCCECRNAAAGHHPLAVTLPVEREQIEALLLERPEMVQQNWLPPETLQDLTDENAVYMKGGA